MHPGTSIVDNSGMDVLFFCTVECSGHRALPGYLPQRPHHAGHSSQGSAGCKSHFYPDDLIHMPPKLELIKFTLNEKDK